MPWRPMMIRGTRVLARCEEDGQLRAESGRVEIRYGPTSPKAYRAAVRNLEEAGDEAILPDDHCVDVDGASGGAPKKTTKASRGKGAKAGAYPTEAEGDEILVYADGACSGNPGPAGSGVVLITREGRRELSEYLGEGTNNIAELTAILRAAEAVDDPSRPVRIYTDSSYAIGLLKKGWKAKANKDLVARVRAAVDRLEDVDLFHVRGHAGHELNEKADELAVEAVQRRSSRGWVDV